MEKISDKYRNIPGWGIDADPANEPTYPIKNYTGDDFERLNYERPPLQRAGLRREARDRDDHDVARLSVARRAARHRANGEGLRVRGPRGREGLP